MTAAFASFWTSWPKVPHQAVPRTRGVPSRHPAPVFIGDVVTPWGQDTMLLALLRAQDETDDDL